MENEKSTGNKYTVKDAAIIGIFCAVMFVVFMVYSTLTGASLFYFHDFQCRWRSTYPRAVLYLHVHESRQAWPCPCLQYHVAIIAGLMMGPFMIPWFLAAASLQNFHVRKECLP